MSGYVFTDFIDRVVTWFSEGRYWKWLGILVVGAWLAWLAASASAAQDFPADHPVIFDTEVHCPAGGTLHLVTDSQALVEAISGALAGTLSPFEFLRRVEAIDASQAQNAAMFVRDCLGVDLQSA